MGVKLVCPECRSSLMSNLTCRCGYTGQRIDDFPLLLPTGAPALYQDSDPLVRRFGRGWQQRLLQLGAERFIELASVLEPRYTPRRIPVLPSELDRARRNCELA